MRSPDSLSMAQPIHNVLAVIPARGGSKGIPRKNLRPLDGKPLILWAIRAASEARRISRVVVSTDDVDIANISMGAGAEAIWRPAELAADDANSESVVLHVLAELEAKERYLPELTAFLQCTSPLLLASDIDGSIATLLENEYDSLLSVEEFHYFVWEKRKREFVGVNHDKSVRFLRQQRRPQYRENGAIYVMRTTGFRRAKHRFFGRTGVFVMPTERSLEIDVEGDLLMAEALVKIQHERRTLASTQGGDR